MTYHYGFLATEKMSKINLKVDKLLLVQRNLLHEHVIHLGFKSEVLP